MSKLNIAGVVILYNPDIEVVNNIKSYCDAFDVLYLVDNSLENNCGMFSDDIFNNCKYIPLLKNAGIAYAMNLAIKEAKELGYQYIITLDQDSQFHSNIIKVYEKTINKINMTDIVALSPQFNTDRLKVSSTTGHTEILVTMQSGTLFIMKWFEKLGEFNEDLFLDVVDWEYFLRINRNQLKVIQCNEAVLNHKPAITKELKFAMFSLKYGTASPLRYYYQVRNLLWAARKYKSFYLLRTLCIKFLKILFLFDDKKQYVRYVIMGIRDANIGRLGSYESIHGENNV